MGDVGAPELIIILVVVLVLFGGAKLPELARSLGKAKKEFQKGVDEGMPDTTDHHQATTPTPTPDIVAPPAIGAPPITASADEVADVSPTSPSTDADDEPHRLS